jgi:hypothetical protein
MIRFGIAGWPADLPSSLRPAIRIHAARGSGTGTARLVAAANARIHENRSRPESTKVDPRQLTERA